MVLPFGVPRPRSGQAERTKNDWTGEPRSYPISTTDAGHRWRATRRSSSALAQVPGDGGGPCGRPADPELEVNIGEVALDRPRTQRHRRGDLLVRPAIGAELEDLAFATGQGVERQVGAGPAAAFRLDERCDLGDERRPGWLICQQDVVPAVEGHEADVRDETGDADCVVERRRQIAGGLEDQRRRRDPWQVVDDV